MKAIKKTKEKIAFSKRNSFDSAFIHLGIHLLPKATN